MGKPVRVLHFVSIMNQAGQETFLMNVYRQINREKVQFDFLCTSVEKGDYDKEIISLGGKLHNLPPNPLEKIKFLNYLGDCYRLYRFFKKHKEYKIFHIHTYHAFNGFLSSFTAKLAGLKNVILHSHNSNAPHPNLHKISRLFLYLIKINRFACSVVAGEWMFGINQVKKNKVKFVNNGINPKIFVFDKAKRSEMRKEFGIGNKTVIGHIGRFNYQKNHDFLIDIFKEVHEKDNNTILMLIGRGELESQIKEKVYRLGLEDAIIFTGIRSDIPDILQAIDVFTLPSHFEGLPVVLVEAQTSGLRCIVSDVISNEIKLTELISFISLNQPPDVWADKIIENSHYKRKDTYQEIVNGGYDIKETARWLENFFLQIG